MKYAISTSSRFKKDFKRISKSGQFNLKNFHNVVNQLAKGEKLAAKYKDHQLKGKYNEFRECHIEPDLLLIYSKEEEILSLLLLRIGSHSELF